MGKGASAFGAGSFTQMIMMGRIDILCRATAMFAIAVACAGVAEAASPSNLPDSVEGGPVEVELISSSRLGCGEDIAKWTATNGGNQCAFDSATRGARIKAQQDTSFGSIETYATVAHTTNGAFTPDQLLARGSSRRSLATDFILVGFKSSAFDNRLNLTAEFARTDRVVDELLQRDWALADSTSRDGRSAMVRLDAVLSDRPGLKWSLRGEYRSVSNDYSVGQSSDLFRYFALPGTRLALSTKARVGQLSFNVGIEKANNPFGVSSARKAGVEFQGVTLGLRSRDFSVNPLEGSTLIGGKTRTGNASLTIDSEMFAGWLLQDTDRLPLVIPHLLNIGYRVSNTENRYQLSTQIYKRTSLGLDGTWETPLGETMLSYWRNRRVNPADATANRTSEILQASHYVRRGNWRFGLDASVSQSRGDGADSYKDRSLSFGQSIAYSVKDGPKLLIQLGQDSGSMRTDSESYVSAERYSSITASLDLSKYLQKRFERPDLRLTFDYRKTVDRSDGEMFLEDELIDRWVEGDRREGFLISFGMKL